MANNNKSPQATQSKRPVNKPPSTKRKQKRANGAMFAWIAIGLVVAIVAVVVIVKTTQGSSSGGKQQPVTAVMLKQITKIPASVYDSVGVTSSISVAPPQVKQGQPPLYYVENGKRVPGGFYWGAEYCPYCAAMRWSIIAAYSRFGTFKNLSTMTSSPDDVYPNTPTFTFYGATYSSPYTAFRSYEVVGPLNNGTTLETTPPKEKALIERYNPQGSFPFIDVGNKVLYVGSAYNPGSLGGLSREDIASALNDPNNEITQAIIATSNYLSAGICATNGAMPSSVCHSSGVQAAAKKLNLTF